MKELQNIFDAYNYLPPPELIANSPASPRDSARLMVVSTRSGLITGDRFANISSRLPTGAVLVFNDTKVLPVRLVLRRENGGEVVVLFLVNELHSGEKVIRGMVDRKITVGEVVIFPTGERIVVSGQDANIFSFHFDFPQEELFRLIETHGHTPLPPYIVNPSLSEEELRTEYQSLLASTGASVAAPTASLHFTQKVFDDLSARGVQVLTISLHVGLGTFAPVKDEQLESGKLHREPFVISPVVATAIAQAKRERRPVIAVGTTVLRALESAASEVLQGNACAGETEIFIRPPYEFRVADGLVTNFHVPRSSLMMLVDAFLQYKHFPKKILDIYSEAIAEGYRLFSFGDGMIIADID